MLIEVGISAMRKSWHPRWRQQHYSGDEGVSWLHLDHSLPPLRFAWENHAGSCHLSELLPISFLVLRCCYVPVAVIVALATLLVIPASYTEAIAFSVDDPRGRAKFHPLIDRIYDQQ